MKLFVAPILLTIFIVGLASADSPARAQSVHVIEVKIEKRKVITGETIRVTQGQQVELRVVTDEEVDLHLHGYDKKAVAKPGETAVIKLDARFPGRFPVTSHGFKGQKPQPGHHASLIFLEVRPR